MPLTDKGKKVMESMMKQYHSKRKAEEVFYSSINAKKKGSNKWHEK